MLEIINISKSFKSDTSSICVLKNTSFSLNNGDIACVLGESGVGKSTLLKIIGGMLEQDSGDVLVNKKKSNETKQQRREERWRVFRDEITYRTNTVICDHTVRDQQGACTVLHINTTTRTRGSIVCDVCVI